MTAEIIDFEAYKAGKYKPKPTFQGFPLEVWKDDKDLLEKMKTVEPRTVFILKQTGSSIRFFQILEIKKGIPNQPLPPKAAY